MSGSREVSVSHPTEDRLTVEPASGVRRSPAVDTSAGTDMSRGRRMDSPSAAEGRQAVTLLGQLPFFIDDLKQAGL